MMRLSLPLSLMLFSAFALPSNAADVIGFIYSGGEYRSDGSGVRGNATLFDGGTVETSDAGARVQLNNGVRIWLAPGTRATMTARSVRLLAGLGQFEPKPAYSLEARAVRVVSSQPGAIVRVALDSTGGTIVEPVKGSVEVTNSRGVAVGQLGEGTAVRFADHAAERSGVNVSGCLFAQGGQYGLTDAVTNIPVRLSGRGLAGEVGHFVAVAGVDAAPSGSVASVNVTGIHRLAAGSCDAGGGAAVLMAVAKPASSEGQLQPAGKLNLFIVEGEGAINNIRQRTAREPVVEVQDENHRPVAGAAVLFALPRGGASGTFANGATTLSVTTDAQGRAVARGLKPNNVAGQFEIAVTASYAGATAIATIRQTNSLTAPTTTSSTNTAGTTASKGASGTASQGGGGVARAAGMALGSKIAIIGGIAASSVVGGLAAAGTFGSGTEPPASR